MDSTAPGDAIKADQYQYEDGTVEVVFAVSDGRVLTLREYPDVPTFNRTTEVAAYRGTHQAVAELPDLMAFEDLDL
ncbi:hypothetical protein [Haloprofundus salinisoli]|uniref:hypothetical protein n=1 Tax=Haloprofundus salinisoli TaxID=2876193 RepID=UPI001CCCC047|nr:hypothetical protein [Haloprofundus salinisoli]